LHGDGPIEAGAGAGKDHHETVAQVLDLSTPGCGDGLAERSEVVLASRVGRWPPVAAPLLALLGVLALRALVIFSAQI